MISKLIRHIEPLTLGFRKISLAALTLRTLDHDSYISGNEKLRTGMFWDVIEVATSSTDPTIHHEINNFLKQVSFSSKQIIEALNKMNDVKELDITAMLVSKVKGCIIFFLERFFKNLFPFFSERKI